MTSQQHNSSNKQSMFDQPSFQQQQRNHQGCYAFFNQLQKDLQFIQLLSNPLYIIQLHARGYLYDQNFMRYLDELNYIKSENFITMVKYPQGLLNLERIKSKGFPELLKKQQNVQKFIKFIMNRNQIIKKSSY